MQQQLQVNLDNCVYVKLQLKVKYEPKFENPEKNTLYCDPVGLKHTLDTAVRRKKIAVFPLTCQKKKIRVG